MADWTLVNVEERAKRRPRKFKIPSRARRHALAPDTLAKLIFETGDFAPRTPPVASGDTSRRAPVPGVPVVRWPATSGCVGERMWVRVMQVDPPLVEGGAPRYGGTLANKPVVVEDLEEGAWIVFGPEHVCDIATDEEHDRTAAGLGIKRCHESPGNLRPTHGTCNENRSEE